MTAPNVSEIDFEIQEKVYENRRIIRIKVSWKSKGGTR